MSKKRKQPKLTDLNIDPDLRDIIEDVRSRAAEIVYKQKTRYPDMGYEEGVRAALEWILDPDDYEGTPIDED
jgi:hypothetical protein